MRIPMTGKAGQDHVGLDQVEREAVLSAIGQALNKEAMRASVSSQSSRTLPMPHNGHPNSFAALMEILDPQRLIRGQEIEPAQLEPVMVRRLKEDLRRLGQTFPSAASSPWSSTVSPKQRPCF